MSRKSIKQIFTHPTPGGPASRGGGWGSTFQKCGKCHELPRKSIKKKSAEKITKTCNPHPTPSDGGGGVRGENFKVTKLQCLNISRECSYPERSRVIRGREGRRQGRIGVRGERDERGRGRETGREGIERSRVSSWTPRGGVGKNLFY